MSLLQEYKKRNENLEWKERFSSLAKNNFGRIFGYTNTNFRTQEAFVGQFESFQQVVDKDRSSWTTTEGAGQEADKHRVVNMLSSKLFKRVGEEGDKTWGGNSKIQLTEKGRAYLDYVGTEAFSAEEKWLLNYLFLLNGHYLGQDNYIVNRVREISTVLSSAGISASNLLNYTRTLLDIKELDRASCVRTTFFYLHSFYADSEFLELYVAASPAEKEELAKYIENNILTQNENCALSKKYRSGGNFNLSMLVDEAKVLYFTLVLIRQNNTDFSAIVNGLIVTYGSRYEIDSAKLWVFINKHTSIFEVICVEVFELDEQIYIEEVIEVRRDEMTPQEYIDDTTIEGKRTAKQIFNSKKRRACELTGYTCTLEKLNACKYFTSKAHGKNYLEVHHLVPQEFRNEFSKSIEVFANYVTLCPFCHELVHKAVDKERISSINFLLSERKERLEAMGLTVTAELLYSFYRIIDR
jgi:hypothetical protein